jgi:hypothetical protein
LKLFQVNETLLRQIVTQPASDNYVFAGSYDSLDTVESMLLNKTCTTVTAAPPSTAAAAVPPTTAIANETSEYPMTNIRSSEHVRGLHRH